MTQPDMPFADRLLRKWGPLTGPARVCGCLLDVLEAALPSYLDEAALQDADPTRVERPASYSRRPVGEELAEEHLPRVILLPGAMVGTPGRDGHGYHAVTWELFAGAVVAGRSDDQGESADLMADTYGLAIVAALVQLGPQAHDQILDLSWTGSTGMATRRGGQQGQRRWQTAIEHRLTVTIDSALTDMAGPADIDSLPVDPGTSIDPGTTIPITGVQVTTDAVAPDGELGD